MAYRRRDSYCSMVDSGAISPLISDKSNVKFDVGLLQSQLNHLQRSLSDLSSRYRVRETMGHTPPDPFLFERWDEVPSPQRALEDDNNSDNASVATYESENVPETYQYQSLNPGQFRLLAIHKPDHPSSENALIRCSLHTYHLRHEHPKYRALSYCWEGDPGTSTTSTKYAIRMYLENLDHDSVDFEVKPNLYHALKQLRNPEKNVFLWVDALCINQKADDRTSEKPEQIKRMPDIYSKAESVVVWLGEAQKGDQLVIDFVKSIVEIGNITTTARRLRHERQKFLQLDEFARFIRRSWFSRRWVIQEVVLAKSCTIHFGNNQIQWASFCVAIENFSELCKELQLPEYRSVVSQLGPDSDILSPQATNAHILVHLKEVLLHRSAFNRASNRKCNLESLVSKCRMFLSTKKHDTIYSLLSIARDIYDDRIKHALGIRYGDDLDEVYAEFVKYCVDTSGSLDIICRPWAHGDPILCNSWVRLVPDSPLTTTDSTHNNGFVGDPDATTSLYSASHGEKAEIKLGTSPFYTCFKALISKGIVLGRVNFVSRKMTNATIPSTSWDILGWKNSAFNTDFDYVCRSLVADRDAGGRGIPSSYRPAFDRIRKDISLTSDVCIPDLINREGQPLFITKYLERVRDVIRERRFFSIAECPEAKMKRPCVDKGRHLVGLTSGDVMVGDLVCILFGCSVPLIIRPSEYQADLSLEAHGRLVDECFIQKAMEGEMLRFAKTIGLEDMSRQIFLV
ncbi:heterokaryon incompatibility protein-domain-containing protein [Xylaria arbuscula]|nr:heterokaryon incompatibility protein-domain-containing protein [Xylaria arbuscula]